MNANKFSEHTSPLARCSPNKTDKSRHGFTAAGEKRGIGRLLWPDGMSLSLPAREVWKELKTNPFAKYGVATAVTAISK